MTNPNLSLSEERSALTAGGAGRGGTHTVAAARGFPLYQLRQWCRCLAAASMPGLWLDESASMRRRALHLTRRHRCAAYADLSSDKERLGSGSFIFVTKLPFPLLLTAARLVIRPQCIRYPHSVRADSVFREIPAHIFQVAPEQLPRARIDSRVERLRKI